MKKIFKRTLDDLIDVIVFFIFICLLFAPLLIVFPSVILSIKYGIMTEKIGVVIMICLFIITPIWCWAVMAEKEKRLGGGNKYQDFRF